MLQGEDKVCFLIKSNIFSKKIWEVSYPIDVFLEMVVDFGEGV